MTSDLDAALAQHPPTPETAVTVTPPRSKCRRHDWSWTEWGDADSRVLSYVEWCVRCHVLKDPARTRRGKNNRKRGNAAELTVARAVGGRKVGPMGWPWDVEMPGYARLQVRKLASPPSINDIRKALDAIAATPSDAMPGYVWIEPGRNGEKLIVFRLKDWQERHGDIDAQDAP
jgi:hypothetical protein